MQLWQVLRSVVEQTMREGAGRAAQNLINRAVVRWNEWRLGVRTEDVVLAQQLGYTNPDYRPYIATDYRSMSMLLDAIEIRPGKDVFLDIGCGKGRAVVMAAERLFDRVIGVELSADLAAAARKNVANALATNRLACRSLEIVTSNADAFPIPDDVTVIYFFNPFTGLALNMVLQNMKSSLDRCPRRLTIICKLPPASAFRSQIEAERWLRLDRRVPNFDGSDCVIYRAEVPVF